MSTVEKKLVIGNVLKAYQDFLAFFPLKPCKTEEEYNNLVQHVNYLVDQNAHVEGNPLFDLYEISLSLLSLWETQFPPPSGTPQEILKHLMEIHNLKQKDLEDCVAQSTLSAFLNGRRGLSKAVAIKLAARFCVSVDAFFE